MASNCEVESSFDPVDSLTEARAGEIGKIYLQAKDAFGNNRIVGGDDVDVKFKSVTNSDIRYRGNVLDRKDGSYLITYSIPLAGSYLVSVLVGGDPVQYCVGPSGERWDSRQYDGSGLYSSPPFCSLDDDLILHVIHGQIHGPSSKLLGLGNAVVGIETGFTIESRDKFGNIRSGASTQNIGSEGDGASDFFRASLVGPSGPVNTVVTSSAVEILTCSDSSVPGYFRLSYGGKTSEDLPHNLSGPAMQTLLSSIHDDNPISSAQVTRETMDGNYQWKITFVNHLDLWSEQPLTVLPGSDGFSLVSDKMSVVKQPSAGIYRLRYTLWEKGLYELTVFSGTTMVGGSSYTVEVANGSPQASSSFAFGPGLEKGVAGEESTFEVHVRDGRQSEVQSIQISAPIIDFVNDVQQLQVLSNVGENFQISFHGQETASIEVGLSTLTDVKVALEALHSIGQVDVSSDGSSVIQHLDNIKVEFLTEHGSLDLMKSSGPNTITKIIEGEAPYRAERHAFYCNADAGYIILSFKEHTATIEFDDHLADFASKISDLVGNAVSIIDPDSSICSTAGKLTFVDFNIELGDVEPFSVSFDALENGSMSIFGNGEEDHGAVNGISPIMGHFSLSLSSDSSEITTPPIRADATAEEVKMSLEEIPTIGSVSVTKDTYGIRKGKDGQNIVPGTASLFNIWSVTFAHVEGKDEFSFGEHTLKLGSSQSLEDLKDQLEALPIAGRVSLQVIRDGEL